MLPPSIDVSVPLSVAVTLSVVAVVVAASDDTNMVVLVVFVTAILLDNLDAVVLSLTDIVDVGAIGAPSDDKISVVVLSVVVLSSILVVVVAIVLVVPLLFAEFRDAV